MNWKLPLILIAGICFCISSAGYLFVKIALRPKRDEDLDEVYWEFEDQHPTLARYHFWSKIAFSAVIISMLLLFLSLLV